MKWSIFSDIHQFLFHLLCFDYLCSLTILPLSGTIFYWFVDYFHISVTVYMYVIYIFSSFISSNFSMLFCYCCWDTTFYVALSFILLLYHFWILCCLKCLPNCKMVSQLSRMFLCVYVSVHEYRISTFCLSIIYFYLHYGMGI